MPLPGIKDDAQPALVRGDAVPRRNREGGEIRHYQVTMKVGFHPGGVNAKFLPFVTGGI